ncbi:MAG: prefoldin subunit alpha [Thermoplasmata archaeon]
MAENVEAQLNYIESLISSVDSQIDSFNRMIGEIQSTIDMISDKEIEKSEDRMISIGSGIYARGTLNLSGNLIVPIGSGFYIEESPADTVNRMKANMENIRKSIQNLASQRNDLANRYSEIYNAQIARAKNR